MWRRRLSEARNMAATRRDAKAVSLEASCMCLYYERTPHTHTTHTNNNKERAQANLRPCLWRLLCAQTHSCTDGKSYLFMQYMTGQLCTQVHTHGERCGARGPPGARGAICVMSCMPSRRVGCGPHTQSTVATRERTEHWPCKPAAKQGPGAFTNTMTNTRCVAIL